MVKCAVCDANAALKRPKDGSALCRPCFFRVFEEEIHNTIVTNNLFTREDKVAIGASGGKGDVDVRVLSTVDLHVLQTPRCLLTS